jgi:hypothetical protein
VVVIITALSVAALACDAVYFNIDQHVDIRSKNVFKLFDEMRDSILSTYILAKKLLSFKSVARTRRCYKRVGLIKRQQYFQELAMYGHEVLMSLQI